MIKKTAGIATILLLILGIAIGIARANVKAAKNQKVDKPELSLRHEKGDVLASKPLRDDGESLLSDKAHVKPLAREDKLAEKSVKEAKDAADRKPELKVWDKHLEA